MVLRRRAVRRGDDPYEVFFFSSGAVEEGWTVKDLAQSRANVLVGFPLGGVLSLAIAGCAAVVLLPQLISVTALSQVMLPVAQAGGKLLLAVIILGIVAATFGAALETTLSAGYTIAQFFGWPWGKFRPPAQAARFHLLMIICLMVGVGTLLTGVDPITVTEISVVFSAVALPLTYLPILIIANDPEYMGEHVNGRALNGVATGLYGDHSGRLDRCDPTVDHHWSWTMTNASQMIREFDGWMPIYTCSIGRCSTCTGSPSQWWMISSCPMSPWRGSAGRHTAAGDHRAAQRARARYPDLRRPPAAVAGCTVRRGALVSEIGVVIKLAIRGETTDLTWTERWVRDHIIGRIPGGRHDP